MQAGLALGASLAHPATYVHGQDDAKQRCVQERLDDVRLARLKVVKAPNCLEDHEQPLNLPAEPVQRGQFFNGELFGGEVRNESQNYVLGRTIGPLNGDYEAYETERPARTVGHPKLSVEIDLALEGEVVAQALADVAVGESAADAHDYGAEVRLQSGEEEASSVLDGGEELAGRSGRDRGG